MSVVEIILIVVGIVFFVGSFFVAEKLSSSDVKKVAEMSESELAIIMDSELAEAKAKISDIVDDTVDLSINKIKRDLEKETTEKLMAIGEYSNAVNDELSKANKEATMLYSMLADKHDEIISSIDRLEGLIEEYKDLEQSLPESMDMVITAKPENNIEPLKPIEPEAFEEGIEAQKIDEISEKVIANPTGFDNTLSKQDDDRRSAIYELYTQGEPVVEIARKLKMGVGEVNLIIKLYKSDVE